MSLGRKLQFSFFRAVYLLLSHGVASVNDTTPRIKVGKPLVVYRFW